MIKRIMFAFLAFALCITTQARLSPAMDIISSRLEMRRCTVSGGNVALDRVEIDESFGYEVQGLTVKELPELSAGTLTLSGTAVMKGQSIEREDFERLRFLSNEGYIGEAQVIFENEVRDVLTLSVNVLDKANFAPETGDKTFETARNISLIKVFSAADPDGDSLSYEIVNYPKNGSVEIRQQEGMFVYRPAEGYTGKDSFSFEAIDQYGNRSSASTVTIKVSKPASQVYFDDMKDHWAHNAAIKMAGTGLMTGERVDGKLCFKPNDAMTRGDFLALCLIMTGHEKDIPFVSKTSFADDSQIPQNIKSYAQYAYDRGIVSGYSNPDGSVNFESTGSITRAEAAVVANKILQLPADFAEVPAYKDASAIPAWASSAIGTLAACGIINGSPDGEIGAGRMLTRAEGAEMICNTAKYYNENKS